MKYLSLLLLIFLQTCPSPEREDPNITRFFIESYKVESKALFSKSVFLLKKEMPSQTENGLTFMKTLQALITPQVFATP